LRNAPRSRPLPPRLSFLQFPFFTHLLALLIGSCTLMLISPEFRSLSMMPPYFLRLRFSAPSLPSDLFPSSLSPITPTLEPVFIWHAALPNCLYCPPPSPLPVMSAKHESPPHWYLISPLRFAKIFLFFLFSPESHEPHLLLRTNYLR